MVGKCIQKEPCGFTEIDYIQSEEVSNNVTSLKDLISML